MSIVNPGTAIKKYVDAQKTKVTVTPALTSGTKIASISVDGVSKDLYCVKDTDTDTKTSQTHSTANGAYPILLKNGTGTGTVTNGALFDGDVTVNPSNGKITAKAFVGALEGNAATATQATKDSAGRQITDTYATKTVATASADGLMSKTDKANMTYVHRYAIVGQTANSANGATWFKFASVTMPGAYWDYYIKFVVWAGYNAEQIDGILSVRFRTNSAKTREASSITWDYANKNINPDNFKLAVSTDAPPKLELWVSTYGYQCFKFEVIAEGDRTSSRAIWTLHNTTGTAGSTAPTSGYTLYTSTLAQIKNKTDSSAYADSAGKATNDKNGVDLTGYVKAISISGKTVTITKGDGTTSTQTTQDTVPTVGNATLTIQKNGASVGTFTANATANKSINITVPTKVSELTNDSNYAKKTEAVGSVTRDSTDPHKIVVESISAAFKTSFTTADTLNTAGSTNLIDKKLFLIGAQSQAANPQTYSNKNCYIEDNLLYSGGSEVYTKSNLVQATINTLGLMSGTHVAKLSSIEEGANKYVLPTATSTTLGGIKVGSGLTINNGVLSSTASAGVGKSTYPSWIFRNPSDTIYFKNLWDVPYVFCVHYDGSKSGTTYISVYWGTSASGDIAYETSTTGAGARSAWGLVPPGASARGRSGNGSLSNGTVYAYPIISSISAAGKELPSNGPFWQ